MASLQKKGEAFYCQFCYLGRRYTVTVGKVPEDEAEAFAGGTDLILLRLKQKLITPPPGIGIEESSSSRAARRPSSPSRPSSRSRFLRSSRSTSTRTGTGRWRRTASRRSSCT